MKKSELKEQIRDAEILIRKSKGSDEHHMDVVAVGSMEAIACSIGKALVDLANTSDQMLKTVYCMCKGLVAEIEDPDGYPSPDEVCLTMKTAKEASFVKNNKKDTLLRIRCQSDWYDRVKEKAAERGETITRYVTTCIALGESVLDGTIWTTPEEDDNDGF